MGELCACVLGAITLIIFFAERGIHDSDSLAGWKTECYSGASGNMGVCSCSCSQDQIWFTHSQIRDLNTQARAGRGSGKKMIIFQIFLHNVITFSFWTGGCNVGFERRSAFESGRSFVVFRGGVVIQSLSLMEYFRENMLKSIFTPRTVLKLGSSVSIYENIIDNTSSQVMQHHLLTCQGVNENAVLQTSLNAKIIWINQKPLQNTNQKQRLSLFPFLLPLTNVRKLGQMLLEIIAWPKKLPCLRE